MGQLLSIITSPEHNGIYMNHMDALFLRELCSMYQNKMCCLDEAAKIQEGTTITSEYITSGSTYYSSTLDHTSNMVTDSIDVMGDMLKNVLEPESEPLGGKVK